MMKVSKLEPFGKIFFITKKPLAYCGIAGNTKGGRFTVGLTSCLTGLESAV
jgi:hypothetical protein